MIDFTEKYKLYTNTELLRIIENPEDYRPEAVETARIIFADRRISEEDVEICRKELNAKKQNILNKERQKEQIRNKAFSILKDINPVRNKPTNTGKIINIISIFFGCLFCYKLYKEFGMITSLLSDFNDWDFSVFLYFFPIIIIPISTILFYKRQKTGWIILTIFLTGSIISSLAAILIEISMNPINVEFFDFTPISISALLLVSLCYLAIILTICKDNIRSIYSISKQTAILTITTTIVLISIFLKFCF